MLSADLCVFPVVKGVRGRDESNFSGLDILRIYSIEAGRLRLTERNNEKSTKEGGSNRSYSPSSFNYTQTQGTGLPDLRAIVKHIDLFI